MRSRMDSQRRMFMFTARYRELAGAPPVSRRVVRIPAIRARSWLFMLILCCHRPKISWWREKIFSRQLLSEVPMILCCRRQKISEIKNKKWAEAHISELQFAFRIDQFSCPIVEHLEGFGEKISCHITFQKNLCQTHSAGNSSRWAERDWFQQNLAAVIYPNDVVVNLHADSTHREKYHFHQRQKKPKKLTRHTGRMEPHRFYTKLAA